MEMIKVAVSGGFDPLHDSHLEYLRAAKSLGDYLMVILNTDEWLVRKKGFVFMPFAARKAILEELRCVDKVVPAIDVNDSVAESLRHYRPDIFAKGGDRCIGTIPEDEYQVCHIENIEFIENVGGEKGSSSSELVRDACRKLAKL
jgi:D-beta-D-heptose 7-phosphate kinase/D-beta-D-heptose 1-phosphate adenosyltransferase